jgi:hypothetical protein
MARHSYSLTSETTAALSSHVKAIADEMEVTTQYVHALLAGDSTDPFAKFLHMFRAVCRKNPDGARGFIAKLNTMLKEETPERSEAFGIGEVARTFGEMVAAADGTPERFEVVKQRHLEATERVTIYAPASHLNNVG